MNKKIIIIIGVLILCFSILLVSFNEFFLLEEEPLKEKTSLRIQDLIDNAEEESIIQIPESIFFENIYINKSLTLIGKNKERTIIDGENKKNVIKINSENVVIRNLTIRNSGGEKKDSGIIINSDKNKIINCNIYRSRKGIFVNNSKYNTIENCFFQDNGEGINCKNSKDNEISKCQIRNNAFGIYLKNSDLENIKNSYLHTNGIAIYAKNSTNTKILNSAVCDNNQDGGGIWVFNCKDIEIKNCNINHNGAGLKLKETIADISNCDFNYNMYNALRLIDTKDTTISNCNIKNSYRTAVYLENSNCEIKNCNFLDNRLYGIESDRNSKFSAKNNFWGSPLGPSLSSLTKRDKISFRPFKNKIFPWKINEIETIGSDWAVEKDFSKKENEIEKTCYIQFKEKDTDGDNVPDYWEEKWDYNPNKKEDHINLDPDNDGLNNIEECYTDKYGSNPFYKDVFIEIDYSKENKPGDKYIEKAKEIFKTHDIELHIDTGELGGSEEIPFSKINSAEKFSDIYWKYFLENNINNPKKGIFHYAIVVDEIKEIYSGFVFIGLNNLDTIGLATKNIQKSYFFLEKDRLIVGGIIHELGHSMGLIIDDHGGIDNLGSSKYFTKEGWTYKNYLSCLNYRYVYLLLGFSDGTHGKGDFDDYSNLDFYFFKDTDFEFQI